MFSINLAAALAWAQAHEYVPAVGDVVATPAPGGGPIWSTILMFGGMFLFIYLIMIRPQQKKHREHQEMINSLQKGDRIQTNGGLMGVITGSDQNELTVEIAPQVRVKVSRGFVHRVVKAGPSGERDKGKH